MSKKHAIYVLRWALLAIPGTYVLAVAQKYIANLYVAMIVSQAVLGYFVYFIDKRIIGGSSNEDSNRD